MVIYVYAIVNMNVFVQKSSRMKCNNRNTHEGPPHFLYFIFCCCYLYIYILLLLLLFLFGGVLSSHPGT